MQAVGTGAGSVCVCMRCSGDGGAATAVFFLNWCFEHFSGLPHLFPPPASLSFSPPNQPFYFPLFKNKKSSNGTRGLVASGNNILPSAGLLK